MRGLPWDEGYSGKGDAWDDYCEWQRTNKVILKRINALIKDTRRDPFNGIGKPELLKGDLAGAWNRRINDKDRLVYYLLDDIIVIVSCKGHYNK